MKVFFDRLADTIHYQVLAGKFGCAVATTHESGGDDTVRYLNHVLNYLGVISVGGFSVATAGRAETVEEAGPSARELGKKLADAVMNGFRDPAQDAILADNRSYFRAIVEENRDFRPEEYDRWVRMGWIE
jgi:multimeric flavodoxin WrbA